MLNGVGGCTIYEAKRNLLCEEYVVWLEYYRKYGTLNHGRRLEWGNALVAMQVNNGFGGKKNMKDFMPYQGKESDEEITLEEAMKRWN